MCDLGTLGVVTGSLRVVSCTGKSMLVHGLHPGSDVPILSAMHGHRFTFVVVPGVRKMGGTP